MLRLGTLRAVVIGALALVVFDRGYAAADSKGDVVTMTAVLVPHDGATRADVVRILVGMRRGFRATKGIEYVDAVDLLASESPPPEVTQAFASLEKVRAALSQGDASKLRKNARSAVDALERNVSIVKRAELVDAYLLFALTECDAGDNEACDAGIRRVLVVREDFAYDVARYPERHLERFARVQGEVLGGPRGTLEVNTEPTGAEVFVDGKSYGPSPVVVPALLGGDHYVTAKAVGFAKHIEKVACSTDAPTSALVELPSSERALLLENDLPRIDLELGEPRAGKAIGGLSAYFYAQQVVLGTVHKRGDNELEVALYLYDLRTKFLLRTEEARIVNDDTLPTQARAMATSIYRGVDRSGAVAAPEDDDAPEADLFYEKWWFWTAVGVVAVSGVAIGLAASSGEASSIPGGWTRVSGPID